ncbi:hypothetical protein KQI46_02935 [Lysinibacillus capsici]|uniref:hypothetical protein n=1 Tax=Lysinibacillus capsici TaxID=2115968 RepID=UPI001C0FC527|nr:hypothetical protein [Lysinibacillus capsici]MBU5250893.1 hypothetical protein [Lysinibacillus capsici]
MYPRIKEDMLLHCGDDDSTNLSLKEIKMGRMKSYTIVCNNHSYEGNHVCGLNSLMKIIEGYIDMNNLSQEKELELIDSVCNQIRTDEISLRFDRNNYAFIID